MQSLNKRAPASRRHMMFELNEEEQILDLYLLVRLKSNKSKEDDQNQYNIIKRQNMLFLRMASALLAVKPQLLRVPT